MRTVLLHGHIFKNAGTTFDWSLARNFGAGFLDHRDDATMRNGGGAHLRNLVQENGELCAISSHCMTRVWPKVPRVRWVPVYLLRHPIVRFQSAYNFERRQGGKTPGAIAARSKSFSEYVEWRMQGRVSRTIRNYQTVYLAGAHGHTSNAMLAMRTFGEAIETVRAVPMIGQVERYDESMVVMENHLRQWFPELDLSYVAQNVGGKKTESGDVAATVSSVLGQLGDLQQRVIDENAYDLALYQLVSKRLDAQIEAVPDFAAHLADFQQRCRTLKRTERSGLRKFL